MFDQLKANPTQFLGRRDGLGTEKLTLVMQLFQEGRIFMIILTTLPLVARSGFAGAGSLREQDFFFWLERSSILLPTCHAVIHEGGRHQAKRCFL